MIIIFAGQEGSAASDPQHGKEIFVSTTARILFRAANPSYKNQKNPILNKLIADLFGKAKIEAKGFTPKSASPGAIGEFRTLGSMRFVSIVDNNSVRVISVKGSVPLLPTKSSINHEIKKMAGFDNFVCDHMSEFAKARFKMSDNVFARVQQYLLPMFDNNRVNMLKSLCKRDNKDEISKLLADKVIKDDASNLNMGNHGISDALNIKHHL